MERVEHTHRDSIEQIAAFTSILGYNARPIQSVNGRLISGQDEGGVTHASAVVSHGGDAAEQEQDHGGAVHWGYSDSEGPEY